MLRLEIAPRPNWQALAQEFGFQFHTMYGQTYWDESAYYRFTLEQIERDLEAPTEEIHQMCLEVVSRVVQDEALLHQCAIPQAFWQYIQDSFQKSDPSLYSRLDFAYDGKNPAKLLENNADTPTSVYETGFWQWLWLETQVDKYQLPRQSDQFNSLQEKLIARFHALKQQVSSRLHFACCQDSIEDRGTVQYLQDCAEEAGIDCDFVFIEDIGMSEDGLLTDTLDMPIYWLFKLYPWEFIFQDEYGQFLPQQACVFVEPPWKAIVSNKALLPLLWQMYPNHPNLLPSFFEKDLAQASTIQTLVKKPFFSREGANISIFNQNEAHGQKPAPSHTTVKSTDGPYGEEGFIYQAYHPLPKFGKHHTLIGSWLVDGQAAGISIREDTSLITQDMSRYLPHIII